MQAERWAGFMSFKLMPARGTIRIGKFDQRLRCSSSLKANITDFRCFPSSVPRKALAALTIRGVAVWARAGGERSPSDTAMLNAATAVGPVSLVRFM